MKNILCIMLLAISGWISLNDYYVLNLKAFTITIPKEWKYQPLQGIDSFVGEIRTTNKSLGFDYSTHGYANFGPKSEQEYIADKNRWFHCPFCKDAKTRIEHTYKVTKCKRADRLKYPTADYITEIKHIDSITKMPITIPQEIKNSAYHIKIDTAANYITKTVWPKQTGSGTTGVYIRSRKSKLSFNLAGTNLNKADQRAALKAFKSISLNE